MGQLEESYAFTDWYPKDVTPKRPGYYEKGVFYDKVVTSLHVRYWDGKVWRKEPGGDVVCRSPWRGLRYRLN